MVAMNANPDSNANSNGVTARTEDIVTPLHFRQQKIKTMSQDLVVSLLSECDFSKLKFLSFIIEYLNLLMVDHKDLLCYAPFLLNNQDIWYQLLSDKALPLSWNRLLFPR